MMPSSKADAVPPRCGGLRPLATVGLGGAARKGIGSRRPAANPLREMVTFHCVHHGGPRLGEAAAKGNTSREGLWGFSQLSHQLELTSSHV